MRVEGDEAHLAHLGYFEVAQHLTGEVLVNEAAVAEANRFPRDLPLEIALDVYLQGDFKGEIAGKAIRFRNSGFVDEDLAGQVLGDFEVPQVGEVSLISFDPHPLLAPHPYIEWFSIRKNHYRTELAPADAWILTGAEAAALDSESGAIRNALGAQVRSTRERAGPDWGV